MTEFNPGLPSTRQIQQFIKDGQEVELKLTTNDVLQGTLLWQDQNCLCITDQEQKTKIVWLHSLVYIQAAGEQ